MRKKLKTEDHSPKVLNNGVPLILKHSTQVFDVASPSSIPLAIYFRIVYCNPFISICVIYI